MFPNLVRKKLKKKKKSKDYLKENHTKTYHNQMTKTQSLKQS